MQRRFSLALAMVILLAPSSVLAQAIVVSGVVRDDAQITIPGALVSIPALGLSQVANDLAEYRFTIPSGQPGQEIRIEARALGHAPTSLTVALRTGTVTQNITLVKRAVQIEGVVVSGTAGRQERRAQSAVVSSIDAAKIAEVAPVTNVQAMLQSRTPGVVIRNNSGTTGTASEIRIRGASSITLSNEPLIYIDGVRMSGGAQQIYGVGNQSGTRLNDIKIEDIESIEVVKGPAAATLYGSDAVAGVISIITKKGRVGAGFVQTINVEYGEVSPNFTQPANWGRCSASALSRPTTYPNCVGEAEGTILSDRPLERERSFGHGNYKNINYSLSGGGDKYSAYFSMGGNGDWGIVPNSFYGQINSRANFNYTVRDNLQMDFGFGLIRVRTDLPRNDNDIYGYLGGGMLGDPRTIGAAKNGWYSQRQTQEISSYSNSDRTTRFQPRAGVSYMPTSWFRNRVAVGADMARTEAFSFWAKNDDGWWDDAPRNTGQVGEARRLEDRFTLDYLGTVTRNLMDAVRADVSIGAQAQARRSDLTDVTGQGLINNDVRSVNSASILLDGGQTSSQNRDIGVFTQADVSWRDRLYFQVGVRRDQSSSFGAKSKPFYSPKVGLAYVISDEDYFRDLVSFLPEGALTQLRLRGAFGVSGRQPTSGARSTYDPATNLVTPDRLVIGVRPNDTGNPELRAERTQELELGFESGLLNDRLGFELTFFHKKGVDQILELPVPGSLGQEGPRVNVGSVLNRGFEMAADARVLTHDNVALQLRGSLATLTNRLLDLGGVPESATRKVGYPLFGNWDYRILNVDVANNRVIVSDSLQFIGNGSNYPGWDAAFSGTLTLFRNLSFYAQIDGRGDRMVFDGTNEFRDRQFGIGEPAVRGAAAYGTNPDGTPTEQAVIEYMRRFGPFETQSGASLNRSEVDGAYLQDGTFFRLREASVNFALPRDWARRYARATSAAIGLTMKNLHTWTDFTGLDPESDQFLTVPADRRWTLRFQVTF